MNGREWIDQTHNVIEQEIIRYETGVSGFGSHRISHLLGQLTMLSHVEKHFWMTEAVWDIRNTIELYRRDQELTRRLFKLSDSLKS